MANQQVRYFDLAVIGGGVTGACVAYGLQRLGLRTALLDAPPGQLGPDKASRGNMGLIWCQSKFANFPLYAKWGFTASEFFPKFVRELEEVSGIGVSYRPVGGLIPCLGEEDFRRREQYLAELRSSVGEDYPARMLSLRELQGMLPKVSFGPEVCGAVWCDKDGFIEPLALMYALRKAFVALGGVLLSNAAAWNIIPEQGGYAVRTCTVTVKAERVVLAAGLSNKKLAAPLGCRVPLFADRGQVMLTERIEDILPVPLLGITRTPGGTVMIGFMHERAGLDTRLVPASVIQEGRWALRVWPDLGRLRIIRSWSGLRVMPDDGQPIYDSLPGHPGIFVVNCHSGVTLASAHALLLPPWLAGRSPMPEGALSLTLERFAAQAEEQC